MFRGINNKISLTINDKEKFEDTKDSVKIRILKPLAKPGE
jgi:hypothetical protein